MSLQSTLSVPNCNSSDCPSSKDSYEGQVNTLIISNILVSFNDASLYFTHNYISVYYKHISQSCLITFAAGSADKTVVLRVHSSNNKLSADMENDKEKLIIQL